MIAARERQRLETWACLLVALVLGLLLVLLAGCAQLGYQPATVPVSRDALTFRAGRASMLHDLVVPGIRARCAAGTLTEDLCLAAVAAEAEYQALATLYHEALAARRVTPDPTRLLAVVEKLVRIGGPLVLRGLGLPSLGGGL
jgi:hypothetical protein